MVGLPVVAPTQPDTRSCAVEVLGGGATAYRSGGGIGEGKMDVDAEATRPEEGGVYQGLALRRGHHHHGRLPLGCPSPWRRLGCNAVHLHQQAR